MQSTIKTLVLVAAFIAALGPNGINAFAQQSAESAPAELSRLEEIRARRVETEQELKAVQARAAALDKTFTNVSTMVETVGLTDGVGNLLRRYRSSLGDVRQDRLDAHDRQDAIARTRVELFELNEKLSNLHHSQGRQARADLVALIQEYELLVSALVEVDSTYMRLIERTEDFRRYIDERFLWAKSAPALQRTDIDRSQEALSWLATPGEWLVAAKAFVRDIGGNPISLIYLLALLALLASRGRLERVLLRQARHGQACDSFKPTSLAALVTIVLSSVWPLLMTFVGWRLTNAQQSVLAVAIGHGLVAAGCMLWPVMFLRRASMKGGLGEAHFAWPVESMQALHGGVGRFAVILAPLVLAAAIMQSQPSRAFADSLGRLLTMLSLLVFSGAMASLLQPTGKILGPALATHSHGWIWRTRHTWYAVACIVPVVLAIAAGMGYHYTTLHLSYRILLTLLLIVGLVFVRGMLMRWFQIARARLAERAATMASQKVEVGGAAEDQPEIQSEAQPPIDLNAVSKQTGQIMKYLLGGMLLIGMWLIWADILPALIMLKQVQLWTAVTAVTLVDLGLAIIMLVLTVAAARNIPGLLELAVLSRLHYLDMGAKHAAATLARYVIVALGLTITFQVLGLQWDHVQWLVAAMTVGLAFGLQEIFANFVSGLIILLERPIRVGDVVTVGTVSGTVSRIRIRATTIVDWDRKELIVPNKTFITDKLVNWTLSDTVLRVVIPVRIAYGSDTEKAKALLLKAANDHELVLDDPAPSAWFMSFGASSLDFELRAFVGKIGDLLPVRHELHMAIDEAFKANGIEIAFPQQDVHLRTIAQNVPENELLKK